MRLSSFGSYLFAGILLTNSLPHFVIGLMGRRNLTPFGRNSSALVNALWGAMNFAGGWLLLRATDRKRDVQADDKTWLVPYEIGCVCWALFGAFYSMKAADESASNQRNT